MFHILNADCMNTIFQQCDIETYLSCMLLSKNTFELFNSLYMLKHLIKKDLETKYKKKTIIYCTNDRCPNKIHRASIKSVLLEKDLDYDSMMKVEFDSILNSIRGSFKSKRLDETITYEYPSLCETFNIGQIPYCLDCLKEFSPDISNMLEDTINILDDY